MKGKRFWFVFVLGVMVPIGTVSAQVSFDMNDGAGLCAAGKLVSGQYHGPLTGYGSKRSSVASAAFDATFYHLDLDTDPARNPVLTGRVRVRGRALTAMQSLVLDLQPPMVVDSVLSSTGSRLTFTHVDDALSIDLPGTAAAGSDIEVDIYYGGNPRGGGFGTFSWGTRAKGDPFLWTLSEPYGASAWWPNKDHPSDKADSVRVTVRVPMNLRVGSNGLLKAEYENGDGTQTFDWHHRYPISTYLVSLAEGRYDVFEQIYNRPDSLAQEFGPLSLPILHYAYPNSKAYQGTSDLSGWGRVLEVLPVFEYWFGPYPFPEEKYGHAHMTRTGGMEHQTMTSMGGSGLGLVAHELAHMWYGDVVTAKTWPHLWLHEGFATLGEILFWESNPARFQGTYDIIFNKYYERARLASGTLVLSDTSSVNDMFAHSRIYSKGWVVLRMLRGMVGDETFRTILRSYAAEDGLRYGNAETSDFQRIAERESGLDLRAFFSQWVEDGTGYPGYSASWSDRSGGGYFIIAVELAQIQEFVTSNVPVFEMPVDIVVVTESGEERFTVDNNQRVQTFELILHDRPIAIEIDPDRWILRADEIVVTVHTEVPQETNLTLTAYPNPARDRLNLSLQLSQPGHIRIRLLDSLGRSVLTLADGLYLSGSYEESFSLPSSLASGSYMVELRSLSRVVRHPVVILR